MPFRISSNIYLADPEFYKCREVDALFRAQQLYKLFCVGQIHIKVQESISQRTKLGWIVSATIYPRATQPKGEVCHISQTEVDSISEQLERFWEIELVLSNKNLSKEEKDCKNYFELHKTWRKTGRYIVLLTFNEKKKDIGDSYQMALRRFHALESKFAKNPALKEKHSWFLCGRFINRRGYVSRSVRPSQRSSLARRKRRPDTVEMGSKWHMINMRFQ